jgi:hypothetical protein
VRAITQLRNLRIDQCIMSYGNASIIKLPLARRARYASRRGLPVCAVRHTRRPPLVKRAAQAIEPTLGTSRTGAVHTNTGVSRQCQSM